MASVDYAVKAVFRLLGWRFAEDGPKAPPFNEILMALALGFKLDVSRLYEGTVLVDNTETKRMELVQTIKNILQTKTLKKMDALKLRGRMPLAAGQLFGRVARKCPNIVPQHAYHAETATISSSAESSLARFPDMLISRIPRVYPPKAWGSGSSSQMHLMMQKIRMRNWSCVG